MPTGMSGTREGKANLSERFPASSWVKPRQEGCGRGLGNAGGGPGPAPGAQT